METPNSINVIRSDHSFRQSSSLQTLTETVRILKCNPTTFITISLLLIYPVSAIHLSNLLVDKSIVKQITKSILIIVESCVLPSTPFVRECCRKLSEIMISSLVSFPLYCTLLLISKAAVVYSVECTYSRKKFVTFKFYLIMRTIWRRVVATYILICGLIVGWITLSVIMLICVSRLLFVIGLSQESVACIAIVTVLCFLVILGYVIIICDLCMVISVWEDVSGLQAVMRSSVLIRGQTRVGLMIFVGSTIGIAIVKGLFEHQVRVLSYGDGDSRICERAVLVFVYSFVVLIDFMMSTVFFFSCKSCSLEAVESGI